MATDVLILWICWALPLTRVHLMSRRLFMSWLRIRRRERLSYRKLLWVLYSFSAMQRIFCLMSLWFYNWDQFDYLQTWNSARQRQWRWSALGMAEPVTTIIVLRGHFGHGAISATLAFILFWMCYYHHPRSIPRVNCELFPELKIAFKAPLGI